VAKHRVPEWQLPEPASELISVWNTGSAFALPDDLDHLASHPKIGWLAVEF
jgi:hypothetical protein